MPDVSIALGGGGVKGIVHVGVIRRLQELGISIKAIAGTSVGGIVGAVAAKGFSPDEIEKHILQMNQNEIFRFSFSNSPSVLDLSGVANVLVDMLGDSTFQDLEIPFACTAVDLKTDQEVIISSGKLLDAVLGTIAIPGVFPPRELGNALLVDGSILDPVPVALARWLAPSLPVIAVVLSPTMEGWIHMPSPRIEDVSNLPQQILDTFSRLKFAQAMNIFTHSIDISSRMLTELRLQIDKPEIIIRPKIDQYSILAKVDTEEVIRLGEQAADEAMDDIYRALNWPQAISRRFRKIPVPAKMLDTTQLEE
ncbi:MAG: patatin-like phospholipase family protein [Leptolinea sp.]